MEDTVSGTIITKTLQYIPIGNPVLMEGDVIFNYDELINSLNVALADAFTDLKTAEPTIAPVEPPFVTQEGTLCAFNAETVYGTTNKIYFSSPLFFLFAGFQSFETLIGGDPYYQIISKDNYNNSKIINALPYYSTLSESPCFNLWTDFQTLLFETSSIPVENEKLDTIKANSRSILTDLEINSNYVVGQVIQYSPQGPLRYHDLISNYPLRRIDLRIFWLDKDNNIYPVFTSENNPITCKLLFRKKIEYR